MKYEIELRPDLYMFQPKPFENPNIDDETENSDKETEDKK